MEQEKRERMEAGKRGKEQVETENYGSITSMDAGETVWEQEREKEWSRKRGKYGSRLNEEKSRE